jgi:hypothetical protein
MQPIDQAVNYRSDGMKHPNFRREGWVFMAGALMEFGPAALVDGGNFLTFAWAAAPDVDPSMTWDVDYQRKCRRQAPKLAAAFTAVLSSGEVKSGYSLIGGGAVTEMPKSWWLTDDPMLRYRTFSIDPDNPFSESTSLPCWIWIDDHSLKIASDRLFRERMGWGPLPEPTPPGPRIEYYLNEEGKIETYEIDHEGVIVSVSIGGPQSAKNKAGRPSMTTRIFKLFADHLRNNSVAERVAWEGEAISREYGGENPPKAATCADRVRPFFNMVERTTDGRIINAGAVLEAMRFPINPDKSLNTPFKSA